MNRAYGAKIMKKKAGAAGRRAEKREAEAAAVERQ